MSAWAAFALGLALGPFAWLAVIFVIAFVVTVVLPACRKLAARAAPKAPLTCKGCGGPLPALGPVTVYLGAHYHSDARCLPEEARPRPHVH